MRFIVVFVTAVCVLFLLKLRWPIQAKSGRDANVLLTGEVTGRNVTSTAKVFKKDR